MTIRTEVSDPERCIAVRAMVHSFGTTITLEASSQRLLTQLVGRLPPLARETSRPTRPALRLSLRTGGVCVCGGMHGTAAVFREGLFQLSGTMAHLLDWCESSARLFVTERAPDFVFVHAGAVVWRGELVFIAGHSMSGKSTLIRALVERGAIYYSDEYAVIDNDGRVHPFPQAPRFRRPGDTAQEIASLDTPGWVVGGRPRLPRLIVLTQFRADAQWQPETLTSGIATLRLMEHAVSARTHPARTMDTLVRAVTSSRVISGIRGDADACADALLELLAAD